VDLASQTVITCFHNGKVFGKCSASVRLLTPRAITIDWGFFPENGDDPTNQHQITASTLAPLLCFANIEIFRLNVDASFRDLDDVFIQQLATSCPKLLCLDLGSQSYIWSPTKVTLAGLVTLAKHCKYIQEVALFFDCSDIQWWYEQNIESNPRTTCISVGCSKVDIHDIVITAKFLSKIFPSLKYIRHQKQLDVDVDDQTHDHWNSVLQHVKRYNNIGGE
jgi:hypothetical protein